MADSASHLVDHVLPRAPYRQWTLSLPRKIRLLVIRNPTLLSQVLSVFLRTLFNYQRRRARQLGITKPLTGAVTMLQLWGSILQLTPHPHSWLPDGVFHTTADGQLQFQYLPPPTNDDVKALLLRIRTRVLKVVSQYDDSMVDDDQMALVDAQYEASRPPLFTIPYTDDELQRPLCAFKDGFSLHADLAIHQKKRRKLEKLLRYGLRPPFAQKRLSLLPDGRVRLKLRKPFYTGQTDIIFEPLTFLRRLAASIPKPRQKLIRFHGIFAPNAKHRADLKALMPPLPEQKQQASNTLRSKKNNSQLNDDSAPKPYKRKWADLMRRVFNHDVLVCQHCQGPTKVIQVVDDPLVIAKICRHLGLPGTLPPVAPARGPPQQDFELQAP
jgi:hypothetical protein